jgi:hypothetical protein
VLVDLVFALHTVMHDGPDDRENEHLS